jgi:hypothetical protein
MQLTERQQKVALELVQVVKNSHNMTDEGIVREIKTIRWEVDFFFPSDAQKSSQ